jgi:flavin reductase (DIM6/NTAB) family NADH-FMN oxidoreductase RutF/DNA-binding MarR family transcriptional regulator
MMGEARGTLAGVEALSPFDERAFRQCLGEFATGVTVITAQVGDQRVGVTANSFTSLSLDPPLVLWSISKQSRSFAAFEAATHFVINVLAVDQIGVSQRFSSLSTDKFTGIPWSMGRTGAPVLDGVVAAIECRRYASYEGGDHLIIVGQVEHFARFEGKALLFLQGRYGIVEDHPGTKTASEPSRDAAGATPRTSALMTLLFRAHFHLSTRFEEHRQAEGLTLAQTRVLVSLYDAPLALGSLTRELYLGERDAEDAIADLVERAYVTRDADGLLRLTEQGRRSREAISARAAAFEAEQLAGLPPDLVEQGRKFLALLVEKQRRAGR